MSSVIITPANSQIVLADHAGDFSGTPATGANSLIEGTPAQTIQFDLGGLASDAGWASAKIDLGANRPSMLVMSACLETQTAASDGDAVDFWVGQTPVSTAGNGNPAGLTGADSAWTWSVGGEMQLTSVGPLNMRADTIHSGLVGVIRPLYRHIIVVARSKTASVALATLADEMHVVLTPNQHADV